MSADPPDAQEFALFETAIGPCAVVWGADGLLGVHTPHGTPEATRRAVHRRFPGAAEAPPPEAVSAAMTAIRGLLAGKRTDLSFIALDMSAVPAFERRVYEEARRIPPGRLSTYGAIAAALGGAGDARAVGQALGANPFPLVVPCHRVVGADGRLGGFSAHGGRVTKRRLIEIEGGRAGDEPDLFDLPTEPRRQ